MRIRTGLAALFAFAALLPAAQAADFSGFHLGLTLGPRNVDADWETTEVRLPTGTPTAPFSDPTATYKDSPFGFGVFAGFNKVLGGKFLLGGELSIGSASASDRTDDRIPGLGNPNSDPTSYAEVKSSLPVALRARGGFLIGSSVLVYARLGLESIKTKATVTCPADTNVCDPDAGTQSFSSSKRLTGLGFGLGVEKMFGEKLSVRAEYRYADYGKFDFTAMPESFTTFGADAEVEVTSGALELSVAYNF